MVRAGASAEQLGVVDVEGSCRHIDEIPRRHQTNNHFREHPLDQAWNSNQRDFPGVHQLGVAGVEGGRRHGQIQMKACSQDIRCRRLAWAGSPCHQEIQMKAWLPNIRCWDLYAPVSWLIEFHNVLEVHFPLASEIVASMERVFVVAVVASFV